MMDLIFFEYRKSADDPDEYADVRGAGPKFFFSCPDVSDARRHVDSARLLHVRDYESDIGLIRLAAKSGCSFVFATTDLLGLPPGACAARLARMRRLAHDCLALGAGVRLCTLARNELELRSPHERAAFGMLLGIGREKMRGMLGEKDGKGARLTNWQEESGGSRKENGGRAVASRRGGVPE
ncbi:MAG: hypothetical protein V1728_04995 [Candidatus Micrarchaeota archaeon]